MNQKAVKLIKFTSKLQFYYSNSHCSPSFFIKHNCKLCREKFKSRRELAQHMTIHDPELQFMCHICTMRFQTPYKLFKHTMSHTTGVITCPNCQIKLNNAEEMEQHDVAVHQWKPEQKADCPKCLIFFDSQHEFDEHYSDHDSDLKCKFECIPCRKGFQTRKTFKRHMDSHRPQEFMCTVCNTAFDSRLELRLHEKTHVLDAPHKCTKCTASFFKKCHLVYHCRESHKTLVKLNPASAERPYICFFCGDAFKKLSGLRMHCSSIHRQSYAYISKNLQSANSFDALAYSNQTLVLNAETRPVINTVTQVSK